MRILRSEGREAAEKVYFDLVWSLDYPSNWESATRRTWFKRAKELSQEKRFFHWELEFPDVFFEDGKYKDRPGFDAVIGNPPYLQKESFTLEEKKAVLANHPECASNVNLATVFIAQAINLTAPNGRHSFIVPKSLLFAKVWRGDRNRLLPNLVRICDVSRAWPEVLLEQVIYVWQGSSDPLPDLVVDRYSHEDFIEGIPFSKGFCELLDAIPIEMNDDLEKILDQCSKNSWNFSQVADLPTGLPYQRMLQVTGEIPAIGGNEIWRYTQLGVKGYFKSSDLAEDQKFIDRLDLDHLIAQRLVAHILSPVPHLEVAVAVNKSRAVPVNTLTCVFPHSDSPFSFWFLCAWMNSRFYSWFAYNFVFSKAIRSMDLYEYYATKVPLPPLDATESPEAIERRRIRFHEYSEILSSISPMELQQRISREVGESAQVSVEFVGFLSQQITELHEERQERIRSFLGWIRSPMGLDVDIDQLKGKTAIQGFSAHPNLGTESAFRVIEKVLARNRVRQDPRSLSKFKEEYMKAAAKLVPIIKRIRAAEFHVDFNIYRLYGLGPDQVAVIEETSAEVVRMKYGWQAKRTR